MIERYTLPEMRAVWSESHRLELWQRIEVLAAEAWADRGVVPAESAKAIAAAPPVDPDTWRAREEVTRHDLAAFVDVLAESVGEHGRWVHYGLTSSDVVDTALGVQLKGAAALLLGRVITLFETVQRAAVAHRDTVMVGRTHGMWAEPTTFGRKMAGFGFELVRAYRRLQTSAESVAYGKVAGAVGTHATVPVDVERHVTEALGLGAEPAATQVVARDRHAAFLTTLAGIGASLERLAVEIRHLQRSEVAEVAEPFGRGQKGSSAMPHKHNPILSENVTGLARLLRGYAVAGLENVALWHERDISHSSAERVILPDACYALDFALHRMTGVVDGLVVDAARMRANLDATRGLVFSQQALLALIRKGMGRDEAYRRVQQASSEALESGRHLRDLLAEDLGDEDLAEVFSLEAVVAHCGMAVDRVAEITPEWLLELEWNAPGLGARSRPPHR
jgi:adenylosuccinate lyase